MFQMNFNKLKRDDSFEELNRLYQQSPIAKVWK